MMSVAQSIQDILTTVAQEITVVLVFFFSLVFFKHIGQRRSTHRKEQKTLTAQSGKLSVLPRKVAVEHCAAALEQKQLQAAQSAEAQMLQLLEQREFTRALHLYRGSERNGHERHFSEALFSSFIQSAIRVGKTDVVERLLSSMMRRDSEPSHEFWRTILRMLSSRKLFDACLSIYNKYGLSLPADKVVFSCLINSALENAAPERAAAMLDRYCEAADLDARDYVLVFRTYVATNDLKSAEKTFEALGEGMTSLMLNLLLLICVNVKQPDRALEHLHKAQALQDSRCSKMHAKLPDGGPIVDVVSYNTVIKGFAQAGMLPQCFDCLHEMRSHNLEPDDVTFRTLLDMCISDNEGAANKVVELLACGDRLVDTAMCTLFIKGLIRAQRFPKAVELYEEMKRRDCNTSKPDILTYSLLIKAFVDSHDLERALLIVEDMTAAGHRPDDIILTHLIEGCRYVGNHELGKRLFTDMLNAGVKPSDFTLTSMVKLYGRCGAHEEAYQLVRGWEKQHAMKPSVIHYTCLMSGCLWSKNYDQAWQAYQTMLEMNVRPDETTMATMIPGMVAAQHWDRVIALATKALQHTPAIPLHAEMLNNALTHMRAATGQGLQAKKLQVMMKQATLRIPPCHPRQPIQLWRDSGK